MEHKQSLEHSSLPLLSLLRDQDRYGYEMISELERRSDHTFQMKEGTLYPVLKKLEAGELCHVLPGGSQWPHPEILPHHPTGPCPAGPGNRRLGAIRPRHPLGFRDHTGIVPPFPKQKQ